MQKFFTILKKLKLSILIEKEKIYRKSILKSDVQYNKFFFWGKFIIITSVLIISAERVFRIKFLDQLESYRVYFSDETLMNISDFFYNNNFNFIMFKYISISISLGFIVIIQITYLIRELILIRYLLLKASNCREKEDYVHLVLILFINIGFVLFSLVTSFIMVTTFFLIIKRHVGV